MASLENGSYYWPLMRRQYLVSLGLVALPALAAAQNRTYNVTVVDSAQLHTVPTATPISALVGKVAGGRVVALSNDPGTAPTIYLRGAMASVEGEPLVVIDGVPSSLSLADITTADVERIEVVNGAVGGATWGIRGGNGVVSITTRRSHLSSPASWFVAHSEVGQSIVPRRVPLSQRHDYQLDASGNFVLDADGNRIPEPDGIQDNAYPVSYDLHAAVLRPRSVYSNYVGGGRNFRSGRTRVAASAGDEHDHGVLTLLRGYSRSTARLAVDHAVTSQIDVSFSAFGARSRDSDPGFTSPFVQLKMIEPLMSSDSADNGNPYYMLDVNDRTSRRDRSSWSIRAEYRPFSWLFVRATTVRDRAKESSLLAYPPNGFGTLGQATNGTQRHSFSEASVITRRSFRKEFIRATARVTVTDEAQRISGEKAIVNQTPPDSPYIDDDLGTSGSGFWRRGRMQSYSIAATTDVGDRLSLDAHVREDGWLVPMRRGPRYYRVAGAYRLGATSVHLAQGTARPLVERTLETAPLLLCPIMGPCGEPLRMPHARELELGVGHQFRQRVDVGYTLARQRTTDVLALAPDFRSNTGVSLDNVGTSVAVTHELTVGARLLSTPALSWDIDVSAHRVRVKMKDMRFAGLFVAGTEQPIPFSLRNGETVGIMYGIRPIRTEAELLETLGTGLLSGTAADYVVNEEGYYVVAADWRTPRERPLSYITCINPASSPCQGYQLYHKVGDANPDVDLGINTRVRWKAVSAYATVTAVLGGDIFNRARFYGFYSGRDKAFDQSARPAEQRKPRSYYYGFADQRHGIYVEDGTFVKLSELAVDWRTPLRRETRIGIVGRNLFTGSRYSGYDPDAAAGERSMFGYRVDGTGHPAYRTIAVRVQLATQE